MGIYNHTGQVVTDLGRSKRFYQEVLGFTPWYEITPPDEATAKLCGLDPPLGVTASYLTLDGFVLELMHYSAPGAVARFTPWRMNEPGLTHLSIAVDDVRQTAGRGDRVRRRDRQVERRRCCPLYPRPRRSAARATADGLSGQSPAETVTKEQRSGSLRLINPPREGP